MNAKNLMISLGILIILAGCVPSIYPLYTNKDVIFDPSLIGSWLIEDEDETWTFAPGDGRSYDMSVSGDDSTAVFRAHLVELDGHRFLDVCPNPPGWSDSPYSDLMLPLHWFGPVSVVGDTMAIALIDPDDLAALADSGIAIPSYVDVHFLRVLTASTEELQKFVTKNPANDVFTVPGRMIRKK